MSSFSLSPLFLPSGAPALHAIESGAVNSAAAMLAAAADAAALSNLRPTPCVFPKRVNALSGR